MTKIVAFGASNSKKSINRQFANYAALQFENATCSLLDLNDYVLPLFSVDLEQEIGFPNAAKAFLNEIEAADFIIISLAEHNGSYTAAFKNLMDWISRIKGKIFESKKMLLLSTSTGQRGGIGVLEAAKQRFPFHGAEIVGYFSLPKFNENFDEKQGISNTELKQAFNEVIGKVKGVLLA